MNVNLMHGAGGADAVRARASPSNGPGGAPQAGTAQVTPAGATIRDYARQKTIPTSSLNPTKSNKDVLTKMKRHAHYLLTGEELCRYLNAEWVDTGHTMMGWGPAGWIPAGHVSVAREVFQEGAPHNVFYRERPIHWQQRAEDEQFLYNVCMGYGARPDTMVWLRGEPLTLVNKRDKYTPFLDCPYENNVPLTIKTVLLE